VTDDRQTDRPRYREMCSIDESSCTRAIQRKNLSRNRKVTVQNKATRFYGSMLLLGMHWPWRTVFRWSAARRLGWRPQCDWRPSVATCRDVADDDNVSCRRRRRQRRQSAWLQPPAQRPPTPDSQCVPDSWCYPSACKRLHRQPWDCDQASTYSRTSPLDASHSDRWVHSVGLNMDRCLHRHTSAKLYIETRIKQGSKRFGHSVWLNGLAVNALGIQTRGPRFDSLVTPLFHSVATLGKLFTHIASWVSQLQETGVQKESFRRLSSYGD